MERRLKALPMAILMIAIVAMIGVGFAAMTAGTQTSTSTIDEDHIILKMNSGSYSTDTYPVKIDMPVVTDTLYYMDGSTAKVKYKVGNGTASQTASVTYAENSQITLTVEPHKALEDYILTAEFRIGSSPAPLVQSYHGYSVAWAYTLTYTSGGQPVVINGTEELSGGNPTGRVVFDLPEITGPMSFGFNLTATLTIPSASLTDGYAVTDYSAFLPIANPDFTIAFTVSEDQRWSSAISCCSWQGS